MRYLRLLFVQLRTSVLLGMQYRLDFFLEGMVEAIWTLTAVVPLLVVYRDRTAIAGWTLPEAMLVVAWFTLLQGVLEGAINPSLSQVVEHVRKGTLDFLLLKPADAQFLVSTARFAPWKATNVVVSAVMIGWAFARLGHAPSPSAVGLALLLLATSCATLYAFWILTVSAAFVVVRVDNLTYLFSSIFDAARWPSTVFRGVMRMVFTFVIPLAVLTTFPAEALLGRLPASRAFGAIAVALIALLVSRVVWVRAIARYTSASS